MKSKLGNRYPLRKGLTESNPLVLTGIHKSEVPALEHLIINLSLQRFGFQTATGISQKISTKNGRRIEKIERKFSYSGRGEKYADYLRVYFNLT